jgi:hypothetical protein
MILFSDERIVWVKLPSSGLGNKISVWSRALVFADLNNCKLFVSGWTQFKLGPWLRNERKKRVYWNCFHQSSILDLVQLHLKFFFSRISYNPELIRKDINFSLFVFDSYRMDFEDIKPYRNLINASFHRSLSSRINQKLISLENPFISVHIRRGDFKNGVHITPLSFYQNVINKIRIISGWPVPVIIYTDAFMQEIEPLLSIGSIRFASNKDDIEDLIEMSRSKLLISAARSTFSYWACFLGDGIVVKHPDEWFVSLRPLINNCSTEWVLGELNDFNDEQKKGIYTLFNKYILNDF